MPTWDDPTIKWDDPLYGFNGGAPVTRIPTWSDTVSTWGAAGEGWNGEVGDAQIGVSPGVYVKDPRPTNANTLQATIITQGGPGQPADDLNMFLKVVIPPCSTDLDYVEYDLDVTAGIPLVTSQAGAHGWFSITQGDDGTTWPGTPAWFTTAGGSVYKRVGRTVYRILGPPERTYAARVRFFDQEWVDAYHICGVPKTLNPPLPAGVFKVWSPTEAFRGPIGKNPVGGTQKDASLLTRLDRTVWRRTSYPTVTLNFSGSNVASILVRSNPVGAKVFGYYKWTQPNNFLIASFGPVPDNTAVTNAMCLCIALADNVWVGYPVGAIGGWTNIPMAAGYTLSTETYTLIGSGTATDPYFVSAQARSYYTP